MIEAPETGTVPINLIQTLDNFGGWHNQAIMKVKDEESRIDRLIKVASRLQAFRFDCKNQGKAAVDAPDKDGIIGVY